MTRFFKKSLIAGLLVLTFFAQKAALAADDEQAVLSTDKSFVQALVKKDRTALAQLLDSEFLWTDVAGKTYSKTKVLGALPLPLLGDETGTQITSHMYGLVGTVQSVRGKDNVLRIWAKRAAGWRLLTYNEVRLADAAPAAEATTNICINPCKTVPYKPKNEGEAGVIKSWSQLETAVTAHDPKTWAPHFLDEFALVASRATTVATKSVRMAQLSKPGIGPAPAGLVQARMVDFPANQPETIVMIGTAQPYSGKPFQISRVWVKRDGMWKMAISYQTTIESARAVVREVK